MSLLQKRKRSPKDVSLSAIQIMLISAHPLWIQACDQILGSLPRRIEVIPVLAAQEMRVELTGALRTYSDIAVAVVSLDLPLDSLGLVRTTSSYH